MYATDIVGYRSASEINTGMIGVYRNMMLAVLTSMLVSMFVSSSPALMAFFFTGIMKWIVMFAPLVAVFGITIALNANPPKPLAHLMLHGFAALMGLSFAAIFVVFKLGSIVGAFLSAAILFGVLSVYGYFTKRSLDNLGSYLFVGLIAIVIAGIVNIFIGSSVLAMVINTLAVIIFLGLTAYDTQNIREQLSDTANDAELVKITGALSLYLNFINIFLSLLQLTGDRE